MIGDKLYRFEEIGSTNEYAKSIALNADNGTVVFADTQTQGKGRFGKSWYSPPGGLYISVILKPSNPGLIPVMGGVSLCETLSRYDIIPGIKWPNDIMLNNKKIAGMLTENVDGTVVLGIGLNLNIQKFPEELASVASSVFLETKKHLDRFMIYQNLCSELDRFYSILESRRTSELLLLWRHYTIMLGRTVIITLPDRSIQGRVLDIDSRGALVIMLPDNKVERIIAGDCQIIR